MDPTIIAELQRTAARHEVWTIILTIITAGIGYWTFFKDYWEKPNITLYSGDSIDLVKSTDFVTRKLHVGCTFTNRSRKAGIVSKVALVVIASDSESSVFRWQMFYHYEGGHAAAPDSKVIPISVPGNSSIFQGIEFQGPDNVKWDAGKWTVRVVAWIGEDRIDRKPTIKDEFEINLDTKFIATLINRQPMEIALLQTVMIEGREIRSDMLT